MKGRKARIGIKEIQSIDIDKIFNMKLLKIVKTCRFCLLFISKWYMLFSNKY